MEQTDRFKSAEEQLLKEYDQLKERIHNASRGIRQFIVTGITFVAAAIALYTCFIIQITDKKNRRLKSITEFGESLQL